MLIIKIGGGSSLNTSAVLYDFTNLKGPKILIHGANARMAEISEKLGKPPVMLTSKSGHTSRRTDPETLDIFMMVYSGVTNKRIVEALQKRGVNAVGLTGIDGRIWEGRRKSTLKIRDGDKLKVIRDDYTGKVTKINTSLIELLVENGYVPVLTPPAISEEGEAINVDNDRAAAVLGGALKADAIVQLFEAPGFMKDIDNPDSLISHIPKDKIEDHYQFAGGRMKKKLMGAKEAIDAGVAKIYFGDGRVDEPIRRAMEGIGTIIS